MFLYVGGQEYSLGIQMGLHPGVNASHKHPVVQVRLKHILTYRHRCLLQELFVVLMMEPMFMNTLVMVFKVQ